MQNEVFFVFGGYSYDNGARQSTIVQYNPNTDKWIKKGELNKARRYHDVITSEDVFLIVGDGPTEECVFTGNTINCTGKEPYLTSRCG